MQKAAIKYIFVFFVFGQAALTAQSPAPAMEYPFRHEIGLDLFPFIDGDPGFHVIWNSQIGEMETNKWNKRSMFYFQVGYIHQRLYNSIDANQVLLLDSTSYVRKSSGYKKNYRIAIGIERQVSRKKMQFYFGGSLTFQAYKVPLYEVKYVYYKNNIQDSTDTYQTKSSGFQPGVMAFGGFKYLISPRWSIGIQFGLNTGIEFSKDEIFRLGKEPKPYHSIVFFEGWNYPLLLYLEYHFGTPSPQPKR